MITLFTALTIIAIAKITKGETIPDIEILMITGILDLMIFGVTITVFS